jgi:hypothetical protein
MILILTPFCFFGFRIAYCEETIPAAFLQEATGQVTVCVLNFSVPLSVWNLILQNNT